LASMQAVGGFSADRFTSVGARCVPEKDVGLPPRRARIEAAVERALRGAIGERARIGPPQALRADAGTPAPWRVVIGHTDGSTPGPLLAGVDSAGGDAPEPSASYARIDAGVPEWWVIRVPTSRLPSAVEVW